MDQLLTGRRNTTLTVALCASLLAHGVVLWTLMWWFVHSTPPPRLEALMQPDVAPIIVMSRPKPPPPPPAQPPPAERQKPPPPDFSKAKQQPPRDDSGEADGKGTANRSTSGDQPMQAWQGMMEQADLTRSSKPADDLDKSKLDMPAQAGVKTAVSSPPAPPPSPAFGVDQPAQLPTKAVATLPLIAIKDPSQPAPGDSKQQPGVKGSPDAKPAPQAPPQREIKGHIAVASDTDSVPFAKANSAHFHDGKMEARQGRRVKTTRIDLGLAEANGPLVLGVVVDASGNVQNVLPLKSSGNTDVDFICQSAVYNWWFEPGKDKDGHPLPDQWVVTID